MRIDACEPRLLAVGRPATSNAVKLTVRGVRSAAHRRWAPYDRNCKKALTLCAPELRLCATIVYPDRARAVLI